MIGSKLIVLAAAVLMVATAGAFLAADGADEADAVVSSGSCGVHLTWTFDSVTKVLTIEGSGDMTNYTASSAAPWGNTVESVDYQPGMTSIGDYAFKGCANLTSFKIKSQITSIGVSAFQGTGLSSVEILGSVETIGNNAFSGCTGTGSLMINDGVKTIGDSAFAGAKFGGMLSIPNSVTIVGLGAFEGCTGFTALSMSSEITQINDYAFKGCTSIPSLDLPNITSIGVEAFNGCTSIASLDLPKVTSVASNAFNGCTSIASLSLPNITSIGNGAFNGCTSIASLSLPKVTSVGSNAFNGCTSIASLSLPNVTSIGNGAFNGCTSIASLSLPNVTLIGSEAFSGCTGLTSLDLSKVTSIGSGAFSGCTNLAGALKIPSSVTSLGSEAFYQCKFTSLVVGDGISTIPSKAFGCSTFTSIKISDSVHSINSDAFKYDGGNSIVFKIEAGDISGLVVNATNLSGHEFSGTAPILIRQTLAVTFASDEGSGTQAPIIAKPGSTVILPTTTTFVNGTKAFLGWKVGGVGDIVTTVTVTSDVALKAEWGAGCVVTFLNPGTTEQTSQVYAKNSDAILPSTTSFTPPKGMTFSGFWALADKTVVNKIVNIQAATTVYAVWVGSYTVTYDANGGTGTQAPDTVAPGGTVKLPSKTTLVAPAGKSFCGWGLSPDETMPVKELTSVMENKTVYAIWGLGLHTVSFKSTGSGTQESIQVATGGTAKLPSDTTFSVPVGKGFYGWSLTQDGSVITQIPNVSEDKTVHAVWKTQWTVTFKSNGGTGTQDPIKAWNAMDVALPSETDFKAPKNSSFVGWSEEKDGKTITKIESIDCNTTLYAIWLEDGKYRITLNVETLGSAAGPGGTVAGEGAFYKDAEIKISATPKTGFEFVQWDDGNLKANRTIVVKSDATYTAQFRSEDAISHYAEFDTQEGSKQPSDEEVYEWEWMSIPDYCGTKAGYTFDCWTFDGDEYGAGDRFQMGTEDVVFTAKWIKNEEPAPDNTPLIIGGAIATVCALAGGLFVFARLRL